MTTDAEHLAVLRLGQATHRPWYWAPLDRAAIERAMELLEREIALSEGRKPPPRKWWKRRLHFS